MHDKPNNFIRVFVISLIHAETLYRMDVVSFFWQTLIATAEKLPRIITCESGLCSDFVA